MEEQTVKHLVVIASFVIVSWTDTVHSQDEATKTTIGTEDILAREIEKGAPTQSIGFEGWNRGVIPLDAYFDAMKGNVLRVREIVLQPDAIIAAHGHDRTPAVIYVIQGELIEHRSDREEPVIRRQGDIYFATRGVVHWSENISPKPTRVLVVDILTTNPE